MHLPKETWAPSTAGWAGRWAPHQTFPGTQEGLNEAIRPKGMVLESTYNCREPQINKQANHYSHFLLQLETIARKQTLKVHTRFPHKIVSSHHLIWILWTSLWNTNSCWCTFQSSLLHSQLEITCQFYQLAFRGFGVWMERDFKNQ